MYNLNLSKDIWKIQYVAQVQATLLCAKMTFSSTLLFPTLNDTCCLVKNGVFFVGKLKPLLVMQDF
jgi:hypothetical protein